MRILMVCACGMSTGMLMNKMQEYWKEKGEEHTIIAKGLSEYAQVSKDYDIVLVGPQVSYRLQRIQEDTGLPAASIPSFDYAVGNCENIMNIANRLFAQKK